MNNMKKYLKDIENDTILAMSEDRETLEKLRQDCIATRKKNTGILDFKRFQVLEPGKGEYV